MCLYKSLKKNESEYSYSKIDWSLNIIFYTFHVPKKMYY